MLENYIWSFVSKIIEGLFLSMCYRKPPKTRLFSTKPVPIAVSTEKRTEAACNTALTFLEHVCNISPMFKLYKYACANIKVSMGSFAIEGKSCLNLPFIRCAQDFPLSSYACLGMPWLACFTGYESSLIGGDQHAQKTSHSTLVYLNLSFPVKYITLWDVWSYLQVPRFPNYPEDKESEATAIDEEITHMKENDQGAKRMHELMERKWQIEGKYCSLRAMYMRCKCSLLTLLWSQGVNSHEV